MKERVKNSTACQFTVGNFVFLSVLPTHTLKKEKEEQMKAFIKKKTFSQIRKHVKKKKKN